MNKKHFLAAMYLRLSRDDSDVGDVTDKDGRLKSESNSIGNQRELIRALSMNSRISNYMIFMLMMGFRAVISTDQNLKE